MQARTDDPVPAAKTLLMAHLQLTEPEAYHYLRFAAMNTRRSVRAVAALLFARREPRVCYFSLNTAKSYVRNLSKKGTRNGERDTHHR